MKFKAFFALLLAVVLSVSLVACGTNPGGTDSSNPSSGTDTGADNTFNGVDVRVAALTGTTGLGMAKLMADQEADTTVNNYTFELFEDPQKLVPELTSDKFDIAALPTNLASSLYNKTSGDLQILAINTLGVLYMLEIGTQTTVDSIADLKGKTVYAFGQGAIPEYALKYILEKNGLAVGEDVEIEFIVDDQIPSVATEGAILMLPEPKVTAVKGQIQNVNVVLDITQEWNKICTTPMAQGCVVVTKKFAQENPQAVAAFLTEYAASINYVKNNAAQASELVAKYEIMPKAALAAKAIPNCNLTFQTGAEMKATLAPFYQVLFNANKASIGGKLPADDFYYGA